MPRSFSRRSKVCHRKSERKKSTSVSVFFGALPPSGNAIGQVTFTRYGVVMSIPTTITLPCTGSGVVGFLPFPRTPPLSRAATVPVVYGNIAA